MITQLTLDAIQRCDSHTPAFLKEMIDLAIRNAANGKETITSCDVRSELTKLHWTLGKEPRCLGPRMMKAECIEPTNETAFCRCGTRHGARVLIWRVKR